MVNSARKTLPFVILTLIFFGFSTYAPGGVPVVPGLTFAWVFHWTTYRPLPFMSLYLVLAGALYDLILYNPMGFSSLLFFLSYLGFYNLRTYIFEFSFLCIWLIFTLSCVLYGLIYYVFAYLLLGQYFDPTFIFYSLFFTALVYPFLSRSMIYIQRKSYE